MDVRLKNELKANAFIAVAAFALFWLGYGFTKGLMFGGAVFALLACVTGASHLWRSRR